MVPGSPESFLLAEPREQAEMHLALRKGIEKVGVDGPEMAGLGSHSELQLECEEKNIPFFLLRPHLRSLLYLHLTYKSHEHLELSLKKKKERKAHYNKLWPFI